MGAITFNAPPAGRPWEVSPFHEGEVQIQQRLAIEKKMDAAARRAIRDFMPDQHRTFFEQLPFLIVGSVEGNGQPHASILANPPGFIHSPNERELVIQARPHGADPLGKTLSIGTPLGLLGIDLQTRRRNRANGSVGRTWETGFRFRVDQSFGNCPKYIQARTPLIGQSGVRLLSSPRLYRSPRLEGPMRDIVCRADTFFIATAHPAAAANRKGKHGVDVSHRGGRPGFVDIDDEGVLTVPDYQGNFFFNTLGNLVLNPRAGLLFIDFETGDLLHLSVIAEIVWSGPQVDAYEKAQRLMRLRVTEALRLEGVLPWRWSAARISPHLMPD